MAFHQPTFAPPSRPTTAHQPDQSAPTTFPSSLHTGLQESQEWILFPARSPTPTQTTSTERTPKTAGLSRLSDFGSLAARSRNDGLACEATDGSIEDDEELDNLDEGLHAFQEPPAYRRSGYFDPSGSILPRHDGLGTFPASTPPIQEQLWHFEQHNPRKRSIGGHQRRRSSVQRRLDAVEDHDTTFVEQERRERIEKWRMEQSKVLLEEIEKQTRRRRTSTVSQRPSHTPSTIDAPRHVEEFGDAQDSQTAAKDKEVTDNPDIEVNDSFWQRITRRVIRDFIGIDDNMLSVIFGESLPEENSAAVNPSSGIESSKSIRLDPSISAPSSLTWESRLLDRIARELGILVQHLSDHPGAFSTPFNPSTSDYAGMPVTVPTSSKSQPKSSTINPNHDTPSSPSFNFNPTLPDAALINPTSAAESKHAALWGIEEEATSNPEQDDHDYWEQPADLKTVFRFLHNRFTTQRRPSPTTKPPLNIATTTTPDSLRRAAIIRQYHPIVSRAAATWDQRHGHARRHSLLRGRSGSSCASSVVGSARRMGLRGGSLGSSSRNYWDIGGSAVGSGVASAIGVGGLGAWGEV